MTERAYISDVATQSVREPRAGIWLRSLSLVAAYTLAIWAIHSFLLSKAFVLESLSLAFSFLFVQSVAILLIRARSFITKTAGQRRAVRLSRLSPSLREKLADYAVGGEHRSGLRRLWRRYPQKFEICFVEMIPSLVGTACERLSILALELGLLEKWRRQYELRDREKRREAIARIGYLNVSEATKMLVDALEDQEPLVRLEAARALLRQADEEMISKVFRFATTQRLLVRAILAEDLKPHALALLDRSIPDALSSSDPRRVRRALEIIGVWRKALPIKGFSRLLAHPDREVQAKAFSIIYYTGMLEDAEALILVGLQNPDDRVKQAAIEAAANTVALSTLPALASLLRSSNPEIATVAGYAISAMGEAGLHILEQEMLSANQVASSAALESLERARLGRAF